MDQMLVAKSSIYLDAVLAFNSFATVTQVFQRFPLIFLLQYLFVSFRKLGAFVAMETALKQRVGL